MARDLTLRGGNGLKDHERSARILLATLMNANPTTFGIVIAALFMAVTSASAGGRYPLRISKVHGEVQMRLDQPGSRWRPAKVGTLDGGPYLLRTGPHSYAHLEGNFRCLDANSLIRINRDSEASIDVLRGQMSAVDGKRGKSLADTFH